MHFLKGPSGFYGLDALLQEDMALIQARIGLGVFDLCHIDALAKASLLRQDLVLEQVDFWCSAGFDLEVIYLDALVPAARLLGEWWACDRINFADVTLAIQRLQQVLYEYSPQFLEHASDKSHGLRVIFFVRPGSQHIFGATMVAEFFRRAGWQVVNLVAQSAADITQELARQSFDVAGFSAGCDVDAPDLRKLIGEARQHSANPGIKILLGGPMVNLNLTLAATLGADWLAADAREAQQLACQADSSLRLAA
jgi:methanogenic corrinoid protein MtbC1